MSESERTRPSVGGPGKETGADPANGAGLGTSDLAALRSRYGFNELPEPHRSAIRRLVSYFWGPIPWMIEVALALAIVVHHWADFAVILALLVVNGAVGFWEEFQADGAIAALRAHLSPTARVLRDGKWTILPARELLPGDRIRVRLGDIVPADARLEGGGPLEIDQSALTGESLPVTRAAGEALYSGSIVRRGEADADVTAIGPATYFGRTSALVAQARTVSHFQRAVLRIGDYLIALALALAVVVELTALLRGEPLLTSLQFALVLAVAAIPVAMPTVLSVTMAVGARRLADQKAIVSRLAAVEELAGMDVLCSDKTGTLTQNRLSVGPPFCLPGDSPESVLRAAAIASRAEDRDPIDDAVLAAPQVPPLLRGYAVREFRPFDPGTKRSEATAVDPAGAMVRASKGAPQAIVELARAPPAVASAIGAAVDGFASHGYRSLGVATSDPTGTWRCLGVLPMSDPLRPDSREVVGQLGALGVTTRMITGDQAAIAGEVARSLGLPTDVAVARAGPGSTASDLDPERIENCRVFAQVLPEDKYRIVEALQARGHIVGMTGDGVNDAPALKKADAGIAVSGATDAARAAAAVVLTEPGLGTIRTAVEEARRIFQRMTAYAIYRIEETIRLLFFITLSILLLGFFPVTATMIVLIAILNDGAILAIAYDRARVAAGPVAWRMRRVLTVASTLGVTGVLSSMVLVLLAADVFRVTGGPLQTLVYLKLSVAGHLVIFLTRTEGPFYRSRPAGILVASVIGTQLLATGIAVSGWLLVPIPVLWAVIVWAYSAGEFLLDDLVKQLTYRWLDRFRPPATPSVRHPTSEARAVLAGFYHRRHRVAATGIPGPPTRPSLPDPSGEGRVDRPPEASIGEPRLLGPGARGRSFPSGLPAGWRDPRPDRSGTARGSPRATLLGT